MKATLLCSVLLVLSLFCFSQQTIDVTEQTIKVAAMKTEEMYFGFAEGDQVIFNFTEADKKDLKEIEIVEWPNTSKFSDFKTSKIENKTLNIGHTSVYKFRFYNSAISGRVCRIKIQRIAANDKLRDFNTNVSWVNRQDTTWNSYTRDVIVGYDTSYEQVTKKELIKTEQREELLFDKPQRVKAASGSDKTYLWFNLPSNTYSVNQTSTVVSWAYWIGVGDEANKAWQQNAKAISGLAKTTASYFTTPLGAYAVGAITDMLIPKVGENVSYFVADEQNARSWLLSQRYLVYDQGNGVGGYKKFLDKRLCQGRFYICLYNDNILQAIDVYVKVAAIIQTDYYQDKTYTEQNVKPRYEKKIFKDPIINTIKMPVTGQL